MSRLTKVKLKHKNNGKAERSFSIEQANKLLSLTRSQWVLSDAAFKWNGKELAKKPKETKEAKESKD